jgi:hypothetical protein
VSVLGLVTATAGTALVLVAMLAVDWFHVAAINLSSSAGELTGQVAGLPGTFPGAFPVAFFGWLAWAVLGVAAIATALGCTRIANRGRYALAGAGAALVGLGLTIAAAISSAVTLAHTLQQAPSVHGFFTVAGAGPWLAVAGFAVLTIAAIAAALTARRS